VPLKKVVQQYGLLRKLKKKQLTVNSRTAGENSPNLVTLLLATFMHWSSLETKSFAEKKTFFVLYLRKGS
jgi:hypothetical protein